MGDLQNALAPIVNGLISSNLELAQFQADTLSTAGQLLAFGGLSFGGAVIGAITAIIALAVVAATNGVYERIDRERLLRITTTTTPSPNAPTIITCDAGFVLMGGACQACGCDATGATGTTCDSTGQCTCNTGYTGLTCSSCATEYYNTGSACAACNCDGNGASATTCADTTGQCTCNTGYTGTTCNTCDTNYYGSGTCTACSCDPTGTSSCDSTTGACTCNTGYTGTTCNTCATNYYGSGTCTACNCYLTGSSSLQCDNSGVCTCNTGYYGTICSTFCGCSTVAGASSGTGCDTSGQCSCNTGYTGLTCSSCSSGYTLFAGQCIDSCPFEDRDFLGADIAGYNPITGYADAAACQALCQSVSACVAFTSQPSTTSCWLKSAQNPISVLNGFTSGPKNC